MTVFRYIFHDSEWGHWNQLYVCPLEPNGCERTQGTNGVYAYVVLV